MMMDEMPIEHMAWETKIGVCDLSSEDEMEASEVPTKQNNVLSLDETASKLVQDRVGINNDLVNESWLRRIVWDIDEADEIDISRPRAVRWILSRTSKQIDSSQMEIDDDEDDVPTSPRRRFIESKRMLPRIFKHAKPAVLHRFLIADPSPAAMLRFHRPRLAKYFFDKPWHCIVSKPSELSPPREDMNKEVELWELRASEGDLLCLEYCEEQPPLIANAGMASTIVTVSRSEKNNENPPFGTYIDLDNEQDDFLFGADEDGDIALCNNLFRAPIFFHDASHLFLLVLKPRLRSVPNKKNTTSFSIRRIPRLAVCGQIEPRRAVPNVDSHSYSRLQEPIAAFAIARTFGAVEQHRNDQVRAMLLSTADVKDALFKHVEVKIPFLRRVLKVAAKSTRGLKNADMWGPKPLLPQPQDDNTPPPNNNGGVNYDQADRLASTFLPEDVCCYEAANAFVARLKHLGLKGRVSRKEAVYACSILHKRSIAARKRYELLNARSRGAVSTTLSSRVAKGVAARNAHNIQAPTLAELATIALKRAKVLERTLACARLIHEELTWSPTALTVAYVEAHVSHNPKAAIRVAGLGDPSGRGEALSLLKSTLTEHKKLGRPSTSERAGRHARNRTEYLARIRQVCTRQRAALSASTISSDNNHDMDEDHVEDTDFALEQAKLRRMVQRRANANSPPPPNAPPNAPTTKDTGAEKKKIPPNDSDAELSDLEKDLEDELMDHDDDDDDTNRNGKKGPSASSDARALEALRKDLATRAAQESAQITANQEQIELPRYAVRRVTRVYDQIEGREKVVVSFDIRRNELERVAKKTGFPLESLKQNEEPPMEDEFEFANLNFWMKSLFDLMDNVPTNDDGPDDFDGSVNTTQAKRQQLPDAKRPLFKFSSGPDESNQQTHKPGRKPSGRRKRDHATDSSNEASLKLNFSKIQRAHNEHKQQLKRQKVEQHKAEAASYHRRTASGNRRGGGPSRRQRGSGAAHRAKPHVKMAKLLDEAVIIPCMRRPTSGPFLAPVNTKAYPTYRQKVSQPMDLATIRDRLTRRFRYRDRKTLIADLQRIALNSAAFNGDQSPITIEARALVDHALASIDGIKDQLDVLEAETKKATEDASTRRYKPARAPSKKNKNVQDLSQGTISQDLSQGTQNLSQGTQSAVEQEEILENGVLPDQENDEEEVIEEKNIIDYDGDTRMSGDDAEDEEEIVEEEVQLISGDSDDDKDAQDDKDIDPLAEALAS